MGISRTYKRYHYQDIMAKIKAGVNSFLVIDEGTREFDRTSKYESRPEK